MYPEISCDGGWARLVVLATEVGGRWSPETVEFLCALAKARAQSEPALDSGCRGGARCQACSASWSFTMSLLDRRPVPGTGADVPSVQQVMRRPVLFASGLGSDEALSPCDAFAWSTRYVFFL